jgi:hypothetical protein
MEATRKQVIAAFSGAGIAFVPAMLRMLGVCPQLSGGWRLGLWWIGGLLLLLIIRAIRR